MPAAAGPLTVEPVESKAQLRRFADVPFVLLGSDPRWSAGVRAYEQWRHDARRHPYFERGDAAFHLARRGGQPVGRLAAHVHGTASEQGWFGMFDVPDVTDLLAGASLGSAWRLARKARERASDTAVCVRCDGDPSVLVPKLLAACRSRGYQTLLSPWSPEGASSDRVHQVFRFDL